MPRVHQWGPFEASARVGLSALFVDVNGSEDKYRSDYNYLPGFNLSEFSLQLGSEGGGLSWLDHLRLEGSGFGDATPHEEASLFFGKRGLYEFQGRYRRQGYFFSLPNFALGGHSSDSARRVTDLSLRLFPHRRVVLDLGYVRNRNFGTAFTSRTAFQDVFELASPRRALTQDFRIGAALDLGHVQASVTQNFRKFKDDRDETASGPLIPSRPAEIRASLPVRLSVPSTQFSVRWAPSWRWDLEGRYRYSDGHVEASRFESLALKLTEGITLEELIRSTSVSDRPEHDGEVELNVELTDNLLFRNSFETHQFDVTGSFFEERTFGGAAPGSGELTLSQSATSGLDYRQIRNRPELEVVVDRRLSFYGGYQYSNRRVEESPDPSRLVTVAHSGFAGATWRPFGQSRFSFEFEKGTADSAFTRTEPQDFTRWKLSSHIPVGGGLQVSPHFVFSDRSAGQFGNGFNSDQRQAGVEVFYQRPDSRLTVSGGYALFDLESLAAIRFVLDREPVEGTSNYRTQLHLVHSRALLPLISWLDLRLGYQYLRDPMESSLPLSRHQGEAGLRLRTGDRLSWDVSWFHVSYNEAPTDLQDYVANRLAFTVIFGF